MSRWIDYYVSDDFVGFWKDRLASPDRSLLVILGLGFDPRALVVSEALAQCARCGKVELLALDLKSRAALGRAGTATEVMVEANRLRLQRLSERLSVKSGEVIFFDNEDHNISGRSVVAAVYAELTQLAKHSDVLVDISSLPRNLFFPLIAYLLRECDHGRFRNLHVAIVEEPSQDAKVVGQEYGSADYLHGFRLSPKDRVVWLPMIGVGRQQLLLKVHELLAHQCAEICPILPFPAQNLRAADDLVVTHREVFDALEISHENIIYCDEHNPFDAYRKVLDLEHYYGTKLAALPGFGSVKAVLSPLSTKTLSLGMLLAAIERTLPVCSVVPGVYALQDAVGSVTTAEPASVPLEVWLAGEPYSLA